MIQKYKAQITLSVELIWEGITPGKGRTPFPLVISSAWTIATVRRANTAANTTAG